MESRQLIFCDYEVFARFWCVTFALPAENRIVQIWDDADALREFYDEHSDDIYVGYNIRQYDQYIFKSILLGLDPYECNNFIIVRKEPGFKFSEAFIKVKLNIFDVINTYHSLKELESYMGDDIRETTVPFSIERKPTEKEIEEILYYNRHDVLETMKVFEAKHKTKNPTDMAPLLHLLNMYRLPISDLGKTSAQLTTKILGAVRREYNDEWNIQIPDTLDIHKYKFVVDWYRNPLNHSDSATLSCVIAGVPTVFAWGGMHGSVDNMIVKDKAILDVDATSLYPSIMLRYDLLSRSLPKGGKDRFKEIVDTRITAKKSGDKNTANALKIVVNSMFGTSRDPKSLMYDPRNGRSVCVAGQLLLLDYIEHLEKATDKIQFIQYNTDGVFFTYDDTDETFNLIDDVTYEWEKRTGLNMEFEDYRSMYQFNVNNYIAVAADGSMHCKGQYLKEKNAIDNDYPIVREALVNYLVHDIIPEKTIYGCRDLAMFAHTIKLTGKYKYITRNFRYDHGRAVADPGQKVDLKVFRIFAVKDIFQGTLYKVKEDDTVQRFSDTPDHVLIYNDDVKGKPVPENLDYDWYVRLAYDRASGLKTPGTLDSLL